LRAKAKTKKDERKQSVRIGEAAAEYNVARRSSCFLSELVTENEEEGKKKKGATSNRKRIGTFPSNSLGRTVIVPEERGKK